MYKPSHHPFKKFLFLVCVLIPSHFIYADIGRFNFTHSYGKSEFRFKYHNNLVLIPLSIKGKKYNFILDTACPSTVIFDLEMLAPEDIMWDKEMSFSGAGTGTPVQAFLAKPLTISLPGIEGSGLVPVVLKKKPEIISDAPILISGVIGFQIFSRFIVEINHSKKSIVLYEPSQYKAGKDAYHLPITIEGTKPYLLTHTSLSKNRNEAIKLLIDSGADLDLLIFQDNNLRKTKRWGMAQGLAGGFNDGFIRGFISFLSTLQLSQFLLFGVTVYFVKEQDFMYENIDSRQGTLGAGLLKKFDITFDYLGKRLYLNPSMTDNISSPVFTKAHSPID